MKKIIFLLSTIVAIGIILMPIKVNEKPIKMYPKGYNGETYPVKQCAEMLSKYTNGIQKNGFLNVKKVTIKDPYTAIRLAKKELSNVGLKGYENISVYYDKESSWRKVSFNDDKEEKSVYMDGNGVTQLVTVFLEQ